jgi:hypothetical protein
MMKMKISISNIVLYIAIVFMGTYISACKPGDPPKLIVTVVDSAGAKVSGAKIEITSGGYYKSGSKSNTYSPGNVKATGTSGSDGTASFEFKLDAVLTVKAYKLDLNGDSLKGSQMAKLVTDETEECTVKIRKGI